MTVIYTGSRVWIFKTICFYSLNISSYNIGLEIHGPEFDSQPHQTNSSWFIVSSSFNSDRFFPKIRIDLKFTSSGKMSGLRCVSGWKLIKWRPGKTNFKEPYSNFQNVFKTFNLPVKNVYLYRSITIHVKLL